MSAGSSLVVVALGGNAVSPLRGDLSVGSERGAVRRAAAELAGLARAGARLLVVHGNGPQVGRLLAAPGLGSPDHLDVHVAQTQGELGYLLVEALDEALDGPPAVAVVTRVVVEAADPAFAAPDKPVGAVLPAPPTGVPSARTPDGRGWRRVVASPLPVAVVEQAAIGRLLETHHVVAGGGGGVALTGRRNARQPRPAVVDKDRVAALLATALEAQTLLFVTDVPHVYDPDAPAGRLPLRALTVAEARARLGAGAFPPGSMAPKIESAVRFVESTGRVARITGLGLVAIAMAGGEGTVIRP